MSTQPQGDLTTRTLAMPADANPSGDIFGGWVLSQMDIAGGIHAGQRAQGRVATVAIEAMHFIKPVHVGDVLCVYAAAERVGRTSLAIRLEAWALRRRLGDRVKVTEGIFTFVALDGEGRPAPIAPDRQQEASSTVQRRFKSSTAPTTDEGEENVRQQIKVKRRRLGLCRVRLRQAHRILPDQRRRHDVVDRHGEEEHRRAHRGQSVGI